MVDVKNLYTSLRILAIGSLFVAVSLSLYMFKKDRNNLYNTLKTIHWVPIMFIMIIGGYMIIDFNKAFTIFHQLFFSNDDWLLYSNDVLILLLPQNFWMVSGLIILYYLNEKYLKNA
jgi:integral membrane protein (TIGR01906 family)